MMCVSWYGEPWSIWGWFDWKQMPSCPYTTQNDEMQCPNLSQFKLIHNITKDDLIIVGHGTSDRNERLHTDGYFWEGFVILRLN